jgi:hypothetical protein
VTVEARSRLATALVVCGALGLLGSLFLEWRISPVHNFLILFGALDRIGGFFAADRTGWQLYSVANILLALLTALLLVAAFVRRRPLRAVAAILALAGLAFAIHALLATPGPTGSRTAIGGSGAGPIVSRDVPALYAAVGPGETVAIVALTLAVLGLAIQRPSRRDETR